jgi:hypothetical protein
MELRMVIKRRRIKQTQPLEVRLAQEVTRLREQVSSLLEDACVIRSKEKLCRLRLHAK